MILAGRTLSKSVYRPPPSCTSRLTHLRSRSHTSLEQTKADILKDEPNVAIRILVVDIASLDSVRKAAAEVLSLKEHVDVNVQNAGIMFAPEGTTGDGEFEPSISSASQKGC